MNKWLRSTAALSLLTLLTVSAAPFASAEFMEGLPPQISQETKAELTEFRGQLGAIKQKEHSIRQLNHQMKDNSYELRQLLNKADDKRLKKQVDTELQNFHERLKTAYRLHKQGEEVKKKIHAARLKRDLKQLRALMEELDGLKGKQLDELRTAHQELETELKRVKERVR